MKVLVIALTPFFADKACHVKILEELLYLQKKPIYCKKRLS